jgi:hypothetical protein
VSLNSPLLIAQTIDLIEFIDFTRVSH